MVATCTRLVGRARLHGGKDRDQPRVLATPRQQLFHPVFLAEVALTDELELQSCSAASRPAFSRSRSPARRTGGSRRSASCARSDTRSCPRRNKLLAGLRKSAPCPSSSTHPQSESHNDWPAVPSPCTIIAMNPVRFRVRRVRDW